MLQCVCLLLLAASALGHLDETTLDHQWDEWKLTHRREYNGLVSVCRKRPLQCGMKSKMSWHVQGSVMKIQAGFAPRRWLSDSLHSCSWENKINSQHVKTCYTFSLPIWKIQAYISWIHVSFFYQAKMSLILFTGRWLSDCTSEANASQQ